MSGAALVDGVVAVAGEVTADERPQLAVLLQALQQAEDRLEVSAPSQDNERLLAACRQLGELHRFGLAPHVGALARELAAAGHVELARGLWLALQQALPDSPPAGWARPTWRPSSAAGKRRWMGGAARSSAFPIATSRCGNSAWRGPCTGWG